MSAAVALACTTYRDGRHLARDAAYDRLVAAMSRDISDELARRNLLTSDRAALARVVGRSDNSRFRTFVTNVTAVPTRTEDLGFDALYRFARDLGMRRCGPVTIRPEVA